VEYQSKEDVCKMITAIAANIRNTSAYKSLPPVFCVISTSVYQFSAFKLNTVQLAN
jgi:hypothetical protein